MLLNVHNLRDLHIRQLLANSETEKELRRLGAPSYKECLRGIGLSGAL